MTILAYWAAAHFPQQRPRGFLYPLGSGTLGYAFPAALGAQAALPGARTLAVAGDGGILYALQELASARQHGLPTTLVIVDDGGYGILREYQASAYGRTHAVDLVAARLRGRGARRSASPSAPAGADGFADALAWAVGPRGRPVGRRRARDPGRRGSRRRDLGRPSSPPCATPARTCRARASTS